MSPSRRLAAIFAADVVGFSSLMGGDEEGTFRALQVLRSVVDPILAGHEGRIANTAGDSIIADYATYCDGVYECRNLRQLERFVTTVAEG